MILLGVCKYGIEVCIRKGIIGMCIDVCGESFGVTQIVLQLLVFVGGKLGIAKFDKSDWNVALAIVSDDVPSISSRKPAVFCRNCAELANDRS